MAPANEPSGALMADADSQSNFGASVQTTKSSQGRKLRQVLQKKQLDVLLQTYSSFIDEPEDTRPTKDANDFYSITRKSSLEGNPIQMSGMAEKRKSGSDLDLKLATELQRASTSPEIRRMRRNKSLISEDEEQNAKNLVTAPISDAEDSENTQAAIDAKKTKNNPSKDSSSGGRKGKKKHMVTKRKKRGDFTTRMLKANDVVTNFGSRCGQKHWEIAADFQEATKELRYHLKSGANIAFEDMADHFDGIVENLFVDENEHRDDDGANQVERRKQQQGGLPSSSQRQPSSQRDDPSFRPLSHDETLTRMNMQVSELLQPVAALGDKVLDLSCAPNGVGFEVEAGRLSSMGSF